MSGATAAARWREALEAWAIPPEILAAAPESPYGFSVALFERAAEQAQARVSPTTKALTGGLPPGGSVLDIGCGAGAASLPVAGLAGTLVGVDESADMLAAFSARATTAGVAVLTQVGRWPDVAADVGVCDVAVARNVAYNVPDLGEFALAMTTHARGRVVLELTTHHPLQWMNPLWQAIHGVTRPERPTIEDAMAVLEDRGLAVRVECWTGRSVLGHMPREDMIAFILQRLCIGGDRVDEVRTALEASPPPEDHAVATVWWSDGA